MHPSYPISIAQDIKRPQDIPRDSLTWLTGDPLAPAPSALILYQLMPEQPSFAYEFYGARNRYNRLVVQTDPFEIRGTSPETGTITLERIAADCFRKRDLIPDALRLSFAVYTNGHGPEIDVILTPYGSERSAARTTILAHYLQAKAASFLSLP